MIHRIRSKSNKRLIIECKVNDKYAYFLLDTGATVGLIHYNKHKEYDLKVGKRFNGTLVGAGGEMSNIRYCDTFVEFEGKKIPQFLLADISSVIKSIKKETNIEILGIISLPQMRITGIGIDANDMEIIIE